MSDGNNEATTDPDTLRPEEVTVSQGFEDTDEQAELTRNLMDSPDPYVRLIAHMSQRQLDMFEMIVEIRDDLAALKRRVNEA